MVLISFMHQIFHYWSNTGPKFCKVVEKESHSLLILIKALYFLQQLKYWTLNPIVAADSLGSFHLIAIFMLADIISCISHIFNNHL